MTQSIGPPSLAQGTRIAVGFSTSISRFIPACGELGFYGGNAMKYIGSSPLARGTQPHCQRTRTPSRFIPAYAGNSTSTITFLAPMAVHPRLRGELCSCSCSCFGIPGSSPLTRGTLEPNQQKIKTPRFIPAYAGNSCPESLFRPQASVHPRLRGELGYFPRRQSLFVSSSPLTRGTPAASFASCSKHRFIPAYAGNSFSCC